MIKTFLTSCLVLSLSIITHAQTKDDWANFARYEEANKTVEKNAVVFMGNSITEGWQRAHPKFFTDNNYICRGIGGQTTMQMLVRFRKDVIDLQPKTVVILAGTNDIARNNGFITLENIMGNIRSMAELAHANQIKVILCSVLPAYEFGWRKELKPADDIIKLNTLIRTYADEQGIPYIDYHSALKNERNGLSETHAPDGVHPVPDTYTLMEGLVKPAIEESLY